MTSENGAAFGHKPGPVRPRREKLAVHDIKFDHGVKNLQCTTSSDPRRRAFYWSSQVRQLPPSTDLRRVFFHRVDRLVRRDSTFLLQSRYFEAPPHLAGKRIEVRRPRSVGFDIALPAQQRSGL